jgi:hypothetical protein
MDYYDVSCELDRISAKIECFSEMIGALAESETDNRYSGTYWFIYDTAKQYVSELETLSGKVMANHMAIRDEQFKQETRKGKKK